MPRYLTVYTGCLEPCQASYYLIVRVANHLIFPSASLFDLQITPYHTFTAPTIPTHATYTTNSTKSNPPFHKDSTSSKMKLLTLNFLTCARKSCKQTQSAFPLHPQDAELEQVELELNPLFIRNILPRLDWDVMRGLSTEVSHSFLPSPTSFPPIPHQSAKELDENMVDINTVNSSVCPTSQRTRPNQKIWNQMIRRH